MLLELFIYITILNVSSLGRIINMKGSADFAIEGKSFTISCIIDDFYDPHYRLIIRKNNTSICTNHIMVFGKYCNYADLMSFSYKDPYSCDIECSDNVTVIASVTIHQVHKEDAVLWTCESVLKDSNYTLQVHYKPTIEQIILNPTGNELMEGSSSSLTCKVDSNPPANITWYHNGQSVSSGSVYSITNAEYTMTGNYTCEAENTIGKNVSQPQSIFIMCAPRIRYEPKTQIRATLDQTVELSITLEAYPYPVFTWKYLLQDKTEKYISDWRIIVSSNDLNSRLIIRDVTSVDFGNYIMYAENSLGNKSVVYTLELEEVVKEEARPGENNNKIGTGIGIGFVVGFLIASIILVGLYFISKKRNKELNLRQIFTDIQARWTTNRGNVTVSNTETTRSNRETSEQPTTGADRTGTDGQTYESLDVSGSDKQTYEDLGIYENQTIS